MLKYRYQETKKIKRLLLETEALKIIFARAKVLPQVEENLRRESLLKSALFSAKVEGNPLSLENLKMALDNGNGTDLKKLEVFNLLRAHQYIYSSKTPKKLSLILIKKLHQMAMKGVSGRIGKFRNEPQAIFNQAGVAVYLAPASFRLPELMKEFVQLASNFGGEIPVKAAVLQFLFEKIHPFADGNGRVGRLISAQIMQKAGYSFRGLVSIEEMIDKNRENYYQALEPSRDTNPFIEFFLESFIEQAGLVLNNLNEKKEELPEDSLLPRRQEILEIVKDHPYCSFDFISRRFSLINPKTLHNDLKQLQEKGFIIKAGKTRGVTYKAVSR